MKTKLPEKISADSLMSNSVNMIFGQGKEEKVNFLHEDMAIQALADKINAILDYLAKEGGEK